MSVVAELPIRELWEPTDVAELAEMVRSCHASKTPMYPIGGGSGLSYGLPATKEGVGISLKGLNRIVDFPARDLTVTAQAGVTARQLRETLATEDQYWPIDPPSADVATLGGIVATNANGPRRFGCGPVRDGVIGVEAMNGRGELFKGGGRVVKNVAGYDFCKLLTGSLGTLGILTQLTLRLHPRPESFRLVRCQPRNLEHADQLLAAMVRSRTMPVAVELLMGEAWVDCPGLRHEAPFPTLVAAVQGSASEVEWMLGRLSDEWSRDGAWSIEQVEKETTEAAWERLIEFAAERSSPLVLKAGVRPSRVTSLMTLAREIDPHCSLQAHAASGIVVMRMSCWPADGLARTLATRLRPAAAPGHVTILYNPSGDEMTHQCAWGGGDAPLDVMTSVKLAFDPDNLLNPDRFVYLEASETGEPRTT